MSEAGMGRFDDPEHYDFSILRGTEMTDADLACLPPLTNIEWLDLSQTRTCCWSSLTTCILRNAPTWPGSGSSPAWRQARASDWPKRWSRS